MISGFLFFRLRMQMLLRRGGKWSFPYWVLAGLCDFSCIFAFCSLFLYLLFLVVVFFSDCLSFYSFDFLSLEMILPILGGGWIMRLLNLIFTKLPPDPGCWRVGNWQILPDGSFCRCRNLILSIPTRISPHRPEDMEIHNSGLKLHGFGVLMQYLSLATRW